MIDRISPIFDLCIFFWFLFFPLPSFFVVSQQPPNHPSSRFAAPTPDFRPSASPLFVLSPTTAVWLRSDNITDTPATHWIPSFTMSMTGYLRIDGAPFRFLGVDWTPANPFGPVLAPAMQQTSRVVQSTQTIFTLEAAGVALQLTFTTPAFPDDLAASSRPIAYMTMLVGSVDNASHSVQLYVDHGSEFPLNSVEERVMFADVSSQWRTSLPPARVLTLYGYDNIAFGVKGDQVKPNWSHVYFATTSPLFSASAQHNASLTRGAFLSSRPLPPSDTNKPRRIGSDFPVSAFTFELGTISPATTRTVVTMFAVDDVFTMKWFGDYQRPLWRHTYDNSVVQMIAAGLQDYATLKTQADRYDTAVLTDLTARAGQRYATVAVLAHRQVMGATTSVWNEEKQEPWLYMKEQSSDGDVSTVDVIFPASPFYLHLEGAEQLRLMLLPLLAYANNETEVSYGLPWAPHHLGTWPVCDLLAQEQEQMPVEESSNMLIMLAAIAQRQGGAVGYLVPYLPLLTTWAEYINASLPDPGVQLCTDDFEGPSPHNANLAVHGIIGISAYAILLTYMDLTEQAVRWNALAASLALAWEELALDVDGSHYKQRYDQNGTWSEKYNLVWQYVLGGDAMTFSSSVRDLELTYYYKQSQQYGIPLDNRQPLSKCDSSSWVAAMASTLEQRQRMIDWLYDFVHATPDRQPFPDLYDTTTNRAGGFFARPVVGGLYNVAILSSMQKHTLQYPKSRKEGRSKSDRAAEHDSSRLCSNKLSYKK